MISGLKGYLFILMELGLPINLIRKTWLVQHPLWHRVKAVRDWHYQLKARRKGHVANFLVAIAHEKGVLCCEQYMGNITGGIFCRVCAREFS